MNKLPVDIKLLKDLQKCLWLRSPPEYNITVIATTDKIHFDVKKGDEYIVYKIDLEELNRASIDEDSLLEFAGIKVKDAIERLGQFIANKNAEQ